jgi:hypothetical protein
MKRKKRAVMTTALFAVILTLTGSLVLFLGSAAQAAARRSHHPGAGKAHGVRQLSELIPFQAWTGDEFGWSVAVSGSTAVVGAPYAGYTGAAYVFTKVGSTWSQQAVLTASDPVVGNDFGSSVAISGSTVVVGSPGTTSGLGSAYVFTGSGGSWSQQAEFTSPNPSGADKFGYSVETSGSLVMVGADGQNVKTGAVYVYADNAGSWSEQAELLASDGIPGDQFGWSMAISGSSLVVSAVRHNANGAIYVFTDVGGIWSQAAELAAADGANNDYFGDKVATDGTRIVAGAPGHDSTTGAAYVFTLSHGQWAQTGEMKASDGAQNDCFGWSVGLSGKTVLVGAEQHNQHAGAAYVFQMKGAKWTQHAELTAGDGGPGDEFGYSATVSGTTAYIGADGAEGGAGSAYVFKL